MKNRLICEIGALRRYLYLDTDGQVRYLDLCNSYKTAVEEL